MTKKILAVVAALAVMLTACSMMAFAAETTTPSDVEEIVLKLEANGAEGTMDPIVADENGVVVVPEHAFTSPNFNFTGWNTTADGADKAYQAGDKITLTESLTLYAQWIHKDVDQDAVELTVTYDANGGEGETLDEFGPYPVNGYAYTAYNNFTKPGATFLGWNTAKDGSGTSYGQDEMFEIYEDVVLYAMWEGGDDIAEKDDTVVEDVTETNQNPETGSSSAVGAIVAGVVAFGALV
ncbi:MAG: InlB B-repeat-containing protein, partial [Clostridia bacterium]|nr:InlB B-repeat-containing protein [Clostridia bacterium]